MTQVKTSIVSKGDSAYQMVFHEDCDQSVLCPVREGWHFARWLDENKKEINPLHIFDGCTIYADWVDDIVPDISITATNDATESQTVTISMSDAGSGIAEYYFGKENPKETETAFTPHNAEHAEVAIETEGLYYFAVKDNAGNMAVLQERFYEVSLDYGDGTCALDRLTGREGNTFTLPLPEKKGHTFVEWSLAGTGTPDLLFDSSKSYLAVYKINSYALSFDGNGGVCEAAPEKITYMDAYGKLPVLERENYDFLGWFTAPTEGEQVTEETKMGAENTTIYAHWKSRFVEVMAEGYTGTFDGIPHTATITAQTEGAVLTYGITEGTYTANEIPSFTNAGNYTIYWKAVHPDCLVTTGTVMVCIKKAEAAIRLSTVDGYINVMTNSNGTLSAYSSDTSIINNVSISGTAIKVLPQNYGKAGTCDITVVVNEAVNYKAVSATQSVTVSQRLLPENLGWWVPAGAYSYGYLLQDGSYFADRDSMWRTTADITILEPGFYYILGYSGAKPRFCLYNTPGDNGSNLWRALTTSDGYAISIPDKKYLKLSICVGAGMNISGCDLRKLTFH